MSIAIKAKHERLLSPPMIVSGQEIAYVESVRYLGVIICRNTKTDSDVHRQVCKLYYQCNKLIRHFRNCTYDVKCDLFRSYCTSLYCSPLWFRSTKATLNKARVAYNNGLRRLLGIPSFCSASEMFVNLSIST